MSGKKYIIPHNYDLTVEHRAKLMGHPPAVIWFTGLSGSGKSTLANHLETYLFEKGVHTYLLDGDNVRTGLCSDLDFSEASRTENIRRIGEVSKLMADAGLVVLSAFVSPFAKDREFVRSRVGSDRFFEVFVDCPLEVCEQRDVKGLYAKARQGLIKDFTGISSPFEAPENPDVHLHSDLEAAEISLEKIIETLVKRKVISQ